MSTTVGSAPHRPTARPPVPSGSNLGLSGVRIGELNSPNKVFDLKVVSRTIGDYWSVGPWQATAYEVPDPQNIDLALSVNGEDVVTLSSRVLGVQLQAIL